MTSVISAAEATIAKIKGETPAEINTNYAVVTADNVGEFYTAE